MDKLFTPYIQPYEYTGWRDEQLSFEKTVYIHAGLSCAPYFRFQGPEAEKFLKKHCTCTFEKYPVGSGKHVLTCNEKGTLTCHGMMFKLAEDCFDTYFMLSLPAYYQMEASEYDMQCIDLTGKKFLFQIGGPRSLELLEKMKAENKRRMVSLVWNHEDILKVYASQFTDDPYCPIDEPNDLAGDFRMAVHQDKVLDVEGIPHYNKQK